MSNGLFDELLNQVQELIENLENQAQEFPTMPTLYQKCQAIAMSNRDFWTMQNSLTEMEDLIQTMPLRDGEFFAQALTDIGP
jgi:hypothetical protein